MSKISGAFGGSGGGFSALFDPGNLRDVVSGDSTREAGEAEKQAKLDAIDKLEQNTQQSQQYIYDLFPQAQQRGQQGFQSAMDVFGQTMPQQANQLLGGNVAAQQNLLGGMQQQHNAILGGPVDYSQFQPYHAQPMNFDFANQQLPQIQALQQMGPQGPDPQSGDVMTPGNAQWQLANLLGGG